MYTDADSLEVLEGFITDITEHREREQELERVSDLLDQTERIANVGGWEIDTETMDMFWTENFFDLLEVDYDEEPPLDEVFDLFHEEDRPIAKNAVEQALDSGESFDEKVQFHRPDGEIRWLRVHGVPTIEDGEVVTLRGAVQDITEQRERERDLKQERRFIEQALDTLDDVFYVVGTEGDLYRWNERLSEGTGYTDEEIVEMEVTEFFPKDEREQITEAIEETLTTGRSIVEAEVLTKDNERVPYEFTAARLTDSEGDLIGLSGVGRDISERKERERELERKNERLEEFANAVSHDLRNPLTVAQGQLDLAREECDSERLDLVARAHERMNVLIDDLLTLAREGKQASDVELVNLVTLTENCWRNIATAEATLDTDVERTIRADRSRLQQLLENLMRNAVEHGGADVTVTVGELDDGFYVEDDGPGIPEEDRDDVFKAGYSTSPDGTGFGLSIVRKIAEAHGWDIRVTGNAAGETRFEITGVEFAA